MEPTTVAEHLRHAGIHVHHADHRHGAGMDVVVVFLEGNRDEHDRAKTVARRIPGVTDVAFSADTRAIMYVIGGGPE